MQAAEEAATKPARQPKRTPAHAAAAVDEAELGPGEGRAAVPLTLAEKKKLKRKRLSKHQRLCNEWERFGFENALVSVFLCVMCFVPSWC